MTRPPKSPIRTPQEQAAANKAEREAKEAAAADQLEQMLDAYEAGEPPPERAPDPADLPPGTLPVRRADLAGTGWTADKQRAFIAHLADHGCVSHACAAVGMSKQSAYALRRRGGRSMFALAWDVAIRTARKVLLDEATERALAGRETPVWYRGEQVGTRIVHNDRMLMFLLSLKTEPPHPEHDDATLAQLWPTMLDMIDAELPPSPDAAELLGVGDGCKNGNDREG